MKNFEIAAAKKHLSELVERASCGEKIGITRNGKLAALIVCTSPTAAAQNIFDGIERIRKRAHRTRRTSVKHLIGEGRE